MVEERGALALLHLQLIWELMHDGERREKALAYINSPGFQNLCDLLDMGDVPEKLRETARKRPAALFDLLRRLHKGAA